MMPSVTRVVHLQTFSSFLWQRASILCSYQLLSTSPLCARLLQPTQLSMLMKSKPTVIHGGHIRSASVTQRSQLSQKVLSILMAHPNIIGSSYKPPNQFHTHSLSSHFRWRSRHAEVECLSLPQIINVVQGKTSEQCYNTGCN